MRSYRETGLAESGGEGKFMGFGSESGFIVSVALAEDTKENLAISHMQESGNKIPEDIVDYPESSSSGYTFSVPYYKKSVFNKNRVLQKGITEVRFLKTEQQIIDLYNEYEARGYEIPINERWGWQRNGKSGKLEVNKDRCSYQKLNIEIKKIEKEHGLESERYKRCLVLNELVDKINETSLSKDRKKDALVSELKEILVKQENDFKETFGISTPTVISRANAREVHIGRTRTPSIFHASQQNTLKDKEKQTPSLPIIVEEVEGLADLTASAAIAEGKDVKPPASRGRKRKEEEREK